MVAYYRNASQPDLHCPDAGANPVELSGQVVIGSQLQPADAARLPAKDPDATVNLALQGSMKPYQWGMNGAPFGKNEPLKVTAGQRLRINVVNLSLIHISEPTRPY